MKKIFGIIAIFLTVFVCSCTKPLEKSSKVWLHRANDVAKARYFQDKYAGLEVDVHFVDSLNTFIIKHDFDEKSDRRLDDWFAAIDRRSDLGFWIDFKNLDYGNMEAAANEMARLRKTYNLKGMIIVESSNAGCLKVFNDLNFRTSYYIPFEYPEKVSKEKLQKLTDNIRDRIEKYDLTTISGYFFQYQFMKDSFPEMRKLIWYELYDPKVRDKFIRLANEDDNTDVILVANIDTIDIDATPRLNNKRIISRFDGQ